VVSSSTNLGALELRSPMRRSTTWADPAAPRADPAALHSISSTTLSVGGESDREGAGGGEAEEAEEAEEAVEAEEVVEAEGESTRADSALPPPSAHDGKVAATTELTFSSPKASPRASPKGSPSPSRERVLPDVLRISREDIRERAEAVDELMRGGA